MEQENIQTSATVKLLILKQVAQTVEGSSTPHIPGPVTTDENIQKKNDVKARSMVLMALPNDIANLSDAIVYAFLANQPNGSQLVHEDLEQINEDDLEEIDLKWQLALLMVTQSSSVKISEPVKENNDAPLIEDWDSEGKDEVESLPEIERKTIEPSVDKGHSHKQLEDQRYFDCGCSWHMTENISYLTNFKEFDEEYVAFGGGAKGGKITYKGIIRIGKLDFEDVCFVKELKFNLFSVLQMCDKKNSALFTDTECFVLSFDFKLADESHVLLKVPRKN
nr:ribonuclease H-like domain-containing protein [Tanacetum cinerariifolium]